MDKTQVKAFMHRGAITIDLKEKILKVVALMVTEDIGSVIVTDTKNPVGIITKRDLVFKVLSNCVNPCDTIIESILERKLITIPPNETLKNAFLKMLSNNIKRLPVIDTDNNELVGIVCVNDILAAFQSPFLAAKAPNQLEVTRV